MSDQSKLKIGHTVWPNGHMCIWSLVNVDDMFGYDKYGNYWFAWVRLHKDKKNEDGFITISGKEKPIRSINPSDLENYEKDMKKK